MFTVFTPETAEDFDDCLTTLHFGRYRGWKIETIPRHYCSWVRTFGGISSEVRQAIEAHLEAGRKR